MPEDKLLKDLLKSRAENKKTRAKKVRQKSGRKAAKKVW